MIKANSDKLKVFDRLISLRNRDLTGMNAEVMRHFANDNRKL